MTITFPATFFGNARNLYYYVNDSLARAVNPTAIYLCRACSQPIAGDDSYTVPQGTSLRAGEPPFGADLCLLDFGGHILG